MEGGKVEGVGMSYLVGILDTCRRLTRSWYYLDLTFDLYSNDLSLVV